MKKTFQLKIPKELDEKLEKYAEKNRSLGFEFNKTAFFIKAAEKFLESEKDSALVTK